MSKHSSNVKQGEKTCEEEKASKKIAATESCKSSKGYIKQEDLDGRFWVGQKPQTKTDLAKKGAKQEP